MRLAVFLGLMILIGLGSPAGAAAEVSENISEEIPLPQPLFDSPISIEKAILERQSIRAYQDRPLNLSDVSQLLWAGQGVTRSRGRRRAAPSAGARYPIEILAAVGKVNDLPSGVYRYRPNGHQLLKLSDRDVRASLARAAFNQEWVQEAPMILVVAAVARRTKRKYGDRATRYVHIEAGAVSENISLQAQSLQLGTTLVGAFRDSDVARILDLEKGEKPVVILPVGYA